MSMDNDIEMTTFNEGTKSTDLLVTTIAVPDGSSASQQPSPTFLAMSYDSMTPSAPVQPVRSPRRSPSPSSNTPVATASGRKKNSPGLLVYHVATFTGAFLR